MKLLALLAFLAVPALADNHVYQIQTDTVTVNKAIVFGDNTVQKTAVTASSSVAVVASVALTNQGANIAATVLTTATVTGIYQINVYAVATITAIGAGSAVSPSFDYTDDFQDETAVAPSFDMTGSTTGISMDTISIEALANTPITYSVFSGHSYSTAKYSLYITVLRL